LLMTTRGLIFDAPPQGSAKLNSCERDLSESKP
jgi:hypothetical protein